MKRLFIDIETSPNLVYSWSVGYRTRLDYQNIIEERTIICVCYKWENEKQVKFLKWDADRQDKSIIEGIVPVLNDADVIIGHNINKFDLPWIRTRALVHNIPTNPHWRTFDTLDFAKKRMRLNSNRLDYLGKLLLGEGKIHTSFDLWKQAYAGDKKALSEMIKYCQKDVELLERVWGRLSKHSAATSHAGVESGGEKWSCPHCGSANVNHKRASLTATGIIKHQIWCQNPKCKRYYMISDKAFQGRSWKKKNVA